MFNAIERVGYLRTALRATSHIYEADAQDCDAGLRWLVCDVICNSMSTLIKYSADHPPVKQFLNNQIDEINSAIRVVRNETFKYYDEDIRDTKKQAFNNATTSWDEWSK